MQERLEGFPLNIRILQEYIAFARVLNFSTAAQQLFISQPTLSTHMQKLESDLGVKLINHGAKPTLTPSGKLFVQYSGDIVKLFLESIEAVRAFDRQAYSLVIEEPQNTGFLFEAIAQAFDYFANEYPAAELNLKSILGHTPLEALESGLVETVKLIDSRRPSDSSFQQYLARQHIEVLPVAQEKPIVWMQSDHPLAKKNDLVIEDLKDTAILVPADIRYDEWRSLIRLWFEQKGLRAGFYMQVTDSMTAFYMTKPNEKVFILPQSMSSGAKTLAARGLISQPIHEESCRYYVSLAWRSDDDNPLLPIFIEQIKKSLMLEPANQPR